LAYVKVKIPDVVRIEYRAGADDPERYRCAWADFEFNWENYSLQIMSDCGNYAYGWHPTQTESFIHLCKRFEYDYLLKKLSSQNIVNKKKTYDNLAELITDSYYNEPKLKYTLPKDWKLILKNTIKENENSSNSLYDDICDLILYQWIFEGLEEFDIWKCIELDYLLSAKVIVGIYMKYIKPQLYKLEG
jgi:hypothetical protein